jgi:single-strand DNA-binding protein
MANLNKVMLIGNLTRDPEVRYTPKGTAVTEIGLAINRTRTDDNGQKHEETTFVDITFWGRVAEIVGEYCAKGKPLYVEGRLQLDQWQDKQSGQNRSKIKVVGENIQLLGSRDGGQQQPPGNTNYDRAQQQAGQMPSQKNYPPSGGQGKPYPTEGDELPA